jgi:membrane protease YdiL (CAAX protease family)
LIPPIPDPAAPPGAPPGPPGEASDPAPQRPGAGTFTIEGRAAPGLFVVGWLATIAGLVAIVVAVMAGGQPAARFLLIGGLVSLSIGLVTGAGGQAIERRARPILPYRGPSPFLVFAASVPIVALATIAAGLLFGVVGLAVDGPAGRLASVAILALVYIGLIRLLVVDGGALTWAEMGVHRPDRPALVEFARGAAWAGPVILVTIIAVGVIAQLVPVLPDSPLPPAGDDRGFVLNLLAGTVIAPIGEELFFRGLATTAWMRGMGRARGIVRGALFFALVHILTISGASAGEAIGLAVAAFAGRLPVALVLGWLYARRGSIWTSMGLHATFNGVLLVIAEAVARSPIVPV